MHREETGDEPRLHRGRIIREGIAHQIQDEADNGYLRHWDEIIKSLSLEQQWDYFLGIADLIMAGESRGGVVIKVGGKQVLPDRCYFNDDDKDMELELSGHTQMDMLKAGYVAVESLI